MVVVDWNSARSDRLWPGWLERRLIDVSIFDPRTTALLIPITRSDFLMDLVGSIAGQSSQADQILVLLNGSDRADLVSLGKSFEFALDRHPEVNRDVLTILTSDTLLRTSEAARMLLETCTADYAGLLADDDMLDVDFVSAWRTQIESVSEPTLFTALIERFTTHEGQRKILGVVEPRSFLTTRVNTNRFLSVFGGLLPGGGTVFPTNLAKKLNVFSSPIPIVTEDQLMSSRFFRAKVEWRPMTGSLYLAREHPGRTGGGSGPESYGNGVVRALQISEESNFAWAAVARAALWRDLQRLPVETRSTFEDGFLEAGGSRRALAVAKSLPQQEWALKLASSARRLLLGRVH